MAERIDGYLVRVRVLRSVAVAFLCGFVLLGAYGVWLMTTQDVQGGRHEAGGMLLTAAVIFGAVGVVMARYAGRSFRR